MLRLGFVAASLLAASGCVILYDADDLRKFDAPPIDAEDHDAFMPDAEIDASPPDAIPIDSNPDNVMVTSIAPTMLDEGVGDDGGRPAIITVTGVDMIDGQLEVAAAFIDGAMEPLTVEDLAVSVDEDAAALSLVIPVDPTIDSGQTRTLRLTFTQGAATAMTHDITVNGLDELTLTAGNKPVTELEPKYSRITVSGNVHFTGTTPAMLVATAGITLNARADVDAVGTTPGVHGCNAGAANNAGSCGLASNGGGGGDKGFDANGLAIGTPGDGGGGGSFGGVGENGDGTMGGAAGALTGNDMLVPVITEGADPGNRGNGGGGGGNPSALGGGAAGPGGAGGGVLYLSAGGTLTISGGSLRAQGGNGTGVGGGGGGGSGGALLVRAFGGITGSGTWLSAAGGTGANSSNDGGNGGAGRIRVDASGAITAPSVTPVAKRGPTWDVASPTVVRVASQNLTLYGEPGKMHGIRLNGDPVMDLQFDFDGIDEIPLTLSPGENVVCALWTVNSTDVIAPEEARSCISVVYVP